MMQVRAFTAIGLLRSTDVSLHLKTIGTPILIPKIVVFFAIGEVPGPWQWAWVHRGQCGEGERFYVGDQFLWGAGVLRDLNEATTLKCNLSQ